MSVFEGAVPTQVVFITVDALRADSARRMSTLSDLAKEYVDVPDCQCTGSGTPTSMPGLMQSRLPTDYGGRARSHPLVPEVPTLAEVLSDAGFDCGGWHSNAYTSRNFDYHRGFDVFADLDSDPPDRGVGENGRKRYGGGFSLVDVVERISQRLGVKAAMTNLFYRLTRYGLIDHRPHVRTERILDAMLDWLPDSSSRTRRFAWGHLMDLHSPYLPPSEYRKQVDGCPPGSRTVWAANEQFRLRPQDITDEQARHLRALYKAGTRYLDDQLHGLVTELRRRNQWDETILVVTADHGELLGDCGMPDDFPWGHANYLRDYVTHVPLVFAGGALPDATVGGVASGVDVAPTVADAVDATVPDEWEGASVGGDSYQEREYVYSVTGRGVRQDQTKSELIPSDTLHASLRTDSTAVLWWSDEVYGPEVFDRTETHADPTVHETRLDPGERTGVDAHLGTLRERFEPVARDLESVAEDAEGLDEETTERLRQLGYIQ